MTVIKGPSRPRAGTFRAKAWQSMRILRRFNVVDLCRTTGSRRDNLRIFIRHLSEHGYIAPFGGRLSGRAGEFQAFRLLRDIGPAYPTVCDRCGRTLGLPCLGDTDHA